VDKARNANHSYGLGLSIAESITKEHNGKIWAESADGINIFRIKLNLVN
jgi:signal transduction histidine kinase